MASHESHDPTSHYDTLDHADEEHDYQVLESITMDQRGDTPDHHSHNVLEYIDQGRESEGGGGEQEGSRL